MATQGWFENFNSNIARREMHYLWVRLHGLPLLKNNKILKSIGNTMGAFQVSPKESLSQMFEVPCILVLMNTEGGFPNQIMLGYVGKEWIQ
jgi:hypothetical protein